MSGLKISVTTTRIAARMPPSCAARTMTGPPPMPSARRVRERPRDFLFDREEEAGTGKEGDDPHHRQRRNVAETERPGGDRARKA